MNTKKDDIHNYPHPFVTVDVLIFGIKDNLLNVVLVKRKAEPFKDMWANPGGFVQMDEDLEAAARRELMEETGIKNVYLEQLYTFGEPKRDPRDRVITVAYFALVPLDQIHLKAASDAKDASWFPVKHLPALAFDHKKILEYAVDRIKNKIGYSTIAVGLLPKKFTLTQLQKVYEIILNQQIDKRNFRKKMLSLGLLDKLNEKTVAAKHRPATLYSFKAKTPVIFD